MAVLQMQRICICALNKERKPILESLQRLGVIEINDVIPEDSVFQKMDVSKTESLLERAIISSNEAMQILENYIPEKKSKLSLLSGRKVVDSEAYDKFSIKYDFILDTAERIVKLEKEIAENKAEIIKLQTQMEILNPWMSLDIPLNFSGTKSTSVFIGTLPDFWSLDMIYEQLAEFRPLEVDIIHSSQEQTNLFLMCEIQKSEAVSEALRLIGFSYPSVIVDMSPSQQNLLFEKQMVDVKTIILKAEEEIKSKVNLREDIRFLEDYNIMRSEKYKVIGQLLQSKRVFVITGYIPKRDSLRVEQNLCERFDLAIEFEELTEDEEAPVLLSNNGFSSPLESTVEAFSLPGNGETDPTMVMSLFYYMLFGLMLSDAAYGVIITLACGVGLLKFRNTLENSKRNTLKMFFFCGISTIFWGVMFGSYFGDIVDVVSETFFDRKIIIKPIWFFPVKEPMRMLVFSMFLGVIHLYTGLGMKLFHSIRQRDMKTILYDVLLWYVLLTSCILALLSMNVFTNTLGLNFTLSGKAGSVSGIITLITAIGIIFTNGRESRNPFKRFLKGLYALYGITGYLSDVLSYSRLLALGLATGVICTVINKMASMTAGIPGIGVFLFILIFIMGHSLNIGINALGAYVHTNRLQYVEFFGKFYEGGGRAFQPFRVNTKYYKFKEKMKNE